MINNIINFFKNRFSVSRALLLVVLFAVVLLAGIWYSLPTLVEWGVGKLAKEGGSPNFAMEVSELDPWKTRIVDLSLGNEGESIAVEQIDILYDPSKLALGEINAFSITGLSVVSNTENVDSKEGGDEEVKWSEIHDLVNEVLINPPLSYLRIRDSDFSILDQNESLQFLFWTSADFLENLIHLTFDLAMNQSSLSGEFNLSREDNASFISTALDVMEVGTLFDNIVSYPRFQELIPHELGVSAGKLAIDGLARIIPTGVEDLFVECNGTGFQLEWEEHNFSIPQFMVFLTPENEHNWTVNSYANVRYGNDLVADGINVSVDQEEDRIELRGGISYLKTENLFPPLEIFGIRFPNLQFEIQDLENLVYEKERTIAFNEFSYEDQFLRLYNGTLSFLLSRDRNLNLRIFPINGALLDLGISFVQFSYFGRVNLDDFPKVDSPQVLLGERVISGDEVLLENLALTFRVQDLSHYLINLLSFEMSGNEFEFNPANMIVGISDTNTQALNIKFDKTSFSIPNQNISVTALEGTIELNSLDPLETNGTQTIWFETLQVGGVDLKDGNFSFEILPDGTFLVSEGSALLYDGAIGVMESSFNMYGDQMTINTSIIQMDGQKIVNLIEGLDVEVNGTFSGRIPFSNQDGKWDFEGGYLQLDSSTNAKLKYKSNGFLTNGITEGSQEYKRMKMTELALENLKLDSLRISFEVDGDERKILGDIRGKSLIKNNTEVSLDYRPKIIAGLAEIMHKLDLKKLGL
ncbi:MAG: YdbH domain-containing protein [Opitutales bacterium]|nr:YdbH domain-containing protein [Opitutales bacterium]